LNEGSGIICGLDEAGRGPLAGPVFAAAVILPFDLEISGLNDSKKLTETARNRLYDEIIEKSISHSIASADHKEIDALNILNATFLAMKRAVDSLRKKPDIVLVDGNKDPGITIFTKCIVGGDAISASIAAASILAKVARDRYMRELDEMYPLYHFSRNKGYATPDHVFRLETFGECPAHRKSFLKNILSADFRSQIEIEKEYES
jgi:ribonuclease HII